MKILSRVLALTALLLTANEAFAASFSPAPTIQNTPNNPTSKCFFTTDAVSGSTPVIECSNGTIQFNINALGAVLGDPGLFSGNNDQAFALWINKDGSNSMEVINTNNHALCGSVLHIFSAFGGAGSGADFRAGTTCTLGGSHVTLSAGSDADFSIVQLTPSSPINFIYPPNEWYAQQFAGQFQTAYTMIFGDVAFGHRGTDTLRVGNAAKDPMAASLISITGDTAAFDFSVSSNEAGSVAASGTWTPSGNPTNGQTVLFAGKTWTFVTGTATGNQTAIKATLALTLAQLAADLNFTTDDDIGTAIFSASATVLSARYMFTGTIGNSYALATGTAGGSVSAATLTGGTNSGAAYGTIKLNANPTNGQTILINTDVWTFVNTITTGNQILIGATAHDTAFNMAVNVPSTATLSNLANYHLMSYGTKSSTSIYVQYNTPGAPGNAFALAAGTASVTLSGATLANGATNLAASRTVMATRNPSEWDFNQPTGAGFRFNVGASLFTALGIDLDGGVYGHTATGGSKGDGTINFKSYYGDGSAGVTCAAGAPTASFETKAGIVIHC